MKNWILTMGLLFLVIGNVQSQSVIGKWKTIDDETGEAKSIVEVYEQSGKIYGKIIRILRKEHVNDVCSLCPGANKNKPILGMVIINGLKKDGDEYKGGTILDPTTGKTYKCNITLDGVDKLKLRGFIGISLLGRTQYWSRI
ncbi:DUF2147 domain-containing protein [Flavobacterium sp. 140616W15]|uniref:DUF2147 domain-containing protein n=1 Tax=Flavobacterium sp. 140616W15 TaxID=2478552 RepID=UPI000F0C98EB|nr:DUF2147 domain-containing protein [Flavobacterium sp. 140616W15]AYN03395.1 DUF2147 domain-containing protein [Flavobacterium sp. 140616W15]